MPVIVIGLVILWIFFGPASDSCPLPKIQCPLPGQCIVTSGFSRWRRHPVTRKVKPHLGLDFKAVNEDVRAVLPGTVARIGNQKNGYGRWIALRHKDGMQTRYAHLSQIFVKQGQKVAASQLLAKSGASGRVSGPHLHFEVRRADGKAVNPRACIAG